MGRLSLRGSLAGCDGHGLNPPTPPHTVPPWCDPATEPHRLESANDRIVRNANDRAALPGILLTCSGFGNSDDRTWPADEFARGVLAAHEIGDVDAVVFGPDIAEPVANIAAQHEGIGCRLAFGFLLPMKLAKGVEASSTCSAANSLSFGTMISTASLTLLK